MFANRAQCFIISPMKQVFWTFASCALALVFSGCGNNNSSGTQIAGTGPFDKNGRYIEEWADNPSKWRKPGNAPSPHELKSDEVPEIAKNEQPPQNSNPLPPANSPKPVSKPTPVIAETQVSTQSRTTVKETKPTAVKSTSTTRKPEPTVVKAKPKPKPKPVVKAKPKSTRYVVKSGDTLSAIASRNGSSVSAIKSANGISGSLIRPGQSLVIPKR